MKEKLEELLKNSKSRYFNYPVAAILECNDGTLFNGVNVETSSPQAGICAERCAIYSAIASGKDKNDFKKIHLMAKSDKEITPCFICRQTLIDYCNKNVEIICYFENKTSVKTVEELCVYAFSGEDL